MFVCSILCSRWGLIKKEALEPDGGTHVVDKSHKSLVLQDHPIALMCKLNSTSEMMTTAQWTICDLSMTMSSHNFWHKGLGRFRELSADH
ncbi:hypothetical protein PoB_000382000 [Plakobranchus ocellatus]|uniref:Ig-like domain-containing protein n=1 Tax=Plakobranchus ocellatus TaxID=259542 RepID=A0AAV3Y2N0_9GAST|nr:hypothetical protein PoB_000382000 [Plakobranchus ocellatus]